MREPNSEEFLKINALKNNGMSREDAWKKILGYTPAELNGVAPKPAKKSVKKETGTNAGDF